MVSGGAAAAAIDARTQPNSVAFMQQSSCIPAHRQQPDWTFAWCSPVQLHRIACRAHSLPCCVSPRRQPVHAAHRSPHPRNRHAVHPVPWRCIHGEAQRSRLPAAPALASRVTCAALSTPKGRPHSAPSACSPALCSRLSISLQPALPCLAPDTSPKGTMLNPVLPASGLYRRSVSRAPPPRS